MKIAYIHQLPLEIYPPATNALSLLAKQAGWEVGAWSSANRKGLPTHSADSVSVSRPAFPGPECGSVRRLVGFLLWHFRVARELARWRPDVLISIEPHSALAVWMYFHLFRGSARLFIHHHEYYAPADFLEAGSRTSRLCHRFEKSDLFTRAEWVSQTNETRLRMMQADCAAVTASKGRIWPNYPRCEWVARAAANRRDALAKPQNDPLRLVCVGSLSFQDTFIRDVVEWVAGRPGVASLHLCGHNVKPDVWEWIDTLAAPNISADHAGCAYDALPDLLVGFDVALVLYKGNTLNFVHNVPNKAVEALACGLEVWYPPEMEGMRLFHKRHSWLRLKEIDFKNLPAQVPSVTPAELPVDFPFTCEAAMAPLLAQIRGKSL